MLFDICNAIRNKEIIQFYYDGGIRIVEPFCYGKNHKGNMVLSGFQVDGYSSSGKAEGWKLFKIEEMKDISLTGKKFELIRPFYNPNDTRMSIIICKV